MYECEDNLGKLLDVNLAKKRAMEMFFADYIHESQIDEIVEYYCKHPEELRNDL